LGVPCLILTTSGIKRNLRRMKEMAISSNSCQWNSELYFNLLNN
jgi:hypothetical protein